jgi:F-type H+-transporting ATPase subunit delta
VSEGDDLLDQLGRAARRMLDEAGASDELRELKRRLQEVEKGAGFTADVVSAVPLTDAERDSIEKRLRARHGPELPIRFAVDSSLLGGVVVRVGDRLLDASLVTRLSHMRETLVGSRGEQR